MMVVILLTTPSTLSIHVCLFVTLHRARVDFVPGSADQLVMKLADSGNREVSLCKLSIGFRL